MKQLDNNLNELIDIVFEANKKIGWWSKEDLELEGKWKIILVASKLALVHSEISEALEGVRKNLKDDHLPHRPMVEVEFADVIIRLLSLSGYLGLDVGGAVKEKFAYNQKRQDHKLENRAAEGGKVI